MAKSGKGLGAAQWAGVPRPAALTLPEIVPHSQKRSVLLRLIGNSRASNRKECRLRLRVFQKFLLADELHETFGTWFRLAF